MEIFGFRNNICSLNHCVNLFVKIKWSCQESEITLSSLLKGWFVKTHIDQPTPTSLQYYQPEVHGEDISSNLAKLHYHIVRIRLGNYLKILHWCLQSIEIKLFQNVSLSSYSCNSSMKIENIVLGLTAPLWWFVCKNQHFRNISCKNRKLFVFRNKFEGKIVSKLCF